MARPKGSTGIGGKSFQDREKSARLRNEVIDSLFLVISDDPRVEQWSDYKKRIVEKLAGTVLPRLNEHSGEDGNPIQITGVDIVVRR
jgi:hypothetical protein